MGYLGKPLTPTEKLNIHAKKTVQEKIFRVLNSAGNVISKTYQEQLMHFKEEIKGNDHILAVKIERDNSPMKG